MHRINTLESGMITHSPRQLSQQVLFRRVFTGRSIIPQSCSPCLAGARDATAIRGLSSSQGVSASPGGAGAELKLFPGPKPQIVHGITGDEPPTAFILSFHMTVFRRRWPTEFQFATFHDSW